MYNIQYIGSRTATGAVAVLDGLYADQNISLGKFDVCVEVCVASMYNLTDRGTYPQLPTQPKKNCSGSN